MHEYSMISSTLIIIILTSWISYEGINKPNWRSNFLFNPYAINNGREQFGLLAHSWFHADYQHLIFNMLSLYMLGSHLEATWVSEFGTKGLVLYVTLYLAGGIASTIIPFFRHRYNSGYRSLGASGAVSAIVFATILWHPTMRLGIMFIPIPIPAYIFGPLYLLLEYYAMKRGNTGIANDGHLSGALFGILFVLMFEPSKATEFISNFI